MDVYIIDGELVDTYGGDYTYKYVYAREEDGQVVFYQYYTGAKERDAEKVDDFDDIEEYMSIYNQLEKR